MGKTWHRACALGCLGALVAAGFLVYMVLHIPLGGSSSWYAADSVVSPDEQHVAAVIRSFGGATLPNGTLVMIREASRPLMTAGDGELRRKDAFDLLAGGRVFSLKWHPPVRLTWRAPRHLVIQVGPHDEVWSKKGAWQNIRVSYRALR